LYSSDGWSTSTRGACTETPGLGVSYFDVQIAAVQTVPIEFTFFWTDNGTWEGRNYVTSIRSSRILSNAN
jgi:hypothetical protein